LPLAATHDAARHGDPSNARTRPYSSLHGGGSRSSRREQTDDQPSGFGRWSSVWVEGVKVFRHEKAVLANELAVEPHLAASVLAALDRDEVPVDLRAIAVVRLFVRLAGREVERARDLLIEERVHHGMEDLRVEAERELADVSCAFVDVEDVIEVLRAIRRCADDLPLLELEDDILEDLSRVEARRVDAQAT